MGSYAQCWLDDLFVGSSKNDIDTEIISLFRPQDKVITASLTGNLPSHLKHYREALDEDPELKVIYYEAPVDVVRDRLNILGYDLDTAKEAFRTWISEEHKRAQEMAEEWNGKDSDSRDLMKGHYDKECEILSKLSPESWIENLKVIQASGLETNYYGRYEGPHEDTAIGYMLSNDWYGYPGYDLFVPLRLAIEAFENSRKLIYDLTDLVWSEYFDYDEDFVEYGLDISASEYSSKSKTIVLTEGKTDAWILSESFNLLYPHLKNYFSFLDFESTGYGGGVGNLANVVKAFAGAGIVNNVIALFDNDTAAVSACKGLEKISLPPNIAIRHLPELELLKSYPTIGPSGSVDLDVNGMAASIELYLGEDVLRMDDNSLVSIQWTGYDKSAKQYQGEVLEKSLLQDRFKDKLSRAQNGEQLDWRDLDAVFQLLFNSFVEKNRKTICKRASEYYAR
ncbi:HEPN/Toprim-associated domain-containing protein [Thiococcus pfennigii]|uniref:HEPN/Toprim-associated domain-containing protein n=1 Tax=Thiococcus pfennigii TaxID=1057 RepID=UPI0019056259